MSYINNFNFLYNLKQKIKFDNIDRLLKKKEWVEISKNKRFKNLHKGKRCFVLGNGPSLNSLNLSYLQNEMVFTVNQISRHPDFEKIKPNYHFWSDPVFFEISKSNSKDIELLETFIKVSNNDISPECFFPVEAFKFIDEFELSRKLKINYFNPKLYLHNEFDESIDYERIVPGFNTVVQYAISMAMYMGFKEIYLLGCDTTTILSRINLALENGEVHYAYDISKNEKERLSNIFERHSMETYFSAEAHLMKGYRIINNLAMNENIKIFNCSKPTLIDSIPKIEFESLFKNE